MLSPTNMDAAEVARRLDTHEECFRQLTGSFTLKEQLVSQLKQDVDTLTEQVRRLTVSTTNPVPLAATPALITPTSEPRLPAPNRYAGDPSGCRGFLNQCFIQFELMPSHFPSSRIKVAYIISLLTDAALAWASPIWEQRPDLISDLTLFITEFRRVFDTPGRKVTAASSLLNISQGDRTVARYALDFRTVAAETGWNDVALSAVFWQGLSERLKDELAALDRPAGLEDLIDLCIRMDQRLQERRMERNKHPRGIQSSSFSTIGSLLSTTPVLDEPMQLGGTSLSPIEKQRRRRAGLCLYCGNNGHLVFNCPLKPGNAKAQ
ncbi:hypothetical protein FKM82_024284 [Ascaphus truei]